MKNEKILRKQLKKIKKNWPESFTPYLLPSGVLRIVASYEGEKLGSLGIEKIEDLEIISVLQKTQLQNPLKNKYIRHLSELISELPALSSPDTTLKIFKEYFPSILDRL